MNISERLTKLRKQMREKQIDAYIIPSSDNHQSEYVGEYFKAREFITGFTGSAGTAVITLTEAGLWTDGRYFLQAEAELDENITLYRMGNPDVPTIKDFLMRVLPEHATLGFDGRVISVQEGLDFANHLAGKQIHIAYTDDLIGEIWEQRPKLASEPVFLLEETYAGESITSKLTRLREKMQSVHANYHILTALDDIAWLLNIRGTDVPYCPLVLSYAVITETQVHLFTEESRLNHTITEYFAKHQVVLHPYDTIYSFVTTWNAKDTVLLDPSKMNYLLYQNIPECVKKVKQTNPTLLWKAIKNEIEIENLRKAHLRDGIAHTKFFYWLKTSFETETITELSASEKLEQLRAEQEGFLSPSFEPICAFQAHAAMCHYTSSAETDCPLTKGHLFLSDTGGHYWEGSTDITRTVALGEICDELKLHFTTVLKSMIQLAKTKFLYGCNGNNLDVLARQPLWELGLDYNHGTGHGVGYLLNIHEGPCALRWRMHGEPMPPFEAGMVITDEPGIYIEGSHGIRIENELLVCKGEETSYGQFMHFEPLTFVPIDLDAVTPELLTEEEKDYLNHYHRQVYNLIAPHLTEEERTWLTYYTRSI